MSEAAPEPMTPVKCDLRDFPYMPLDVRRLRDSGLAALERPEDCWAALLLYCASWHQVPAGSLPDDDRVLAQLAGYGRVVPAWIKVRAGALRGFVKCSDGRLYHPVVAEKARAAWRAKLEQRWRTECARVRKHNQRHGSRLPLPSLAEYQSRVNGEVPLDTQPMSHGTSEESPSGQELQGRETETETLRFAPACAEDEEFELSVERIWKALPDEPRELSSKERIRSAVLQLVADGRDHRAVTIAVERFCVKSRRAKEKAGQFMGKGHEWLLLMKRTSWEVYLPSPDDLFRDGLTPPERLALDDVRTWQRRPRDWQPSWGPAPDQPGCKVPGKILTFCGIAPPPLAEAS